jgi:elongation factor 1 alpha-like protein
MQRTRNVGYDDDLYDDDDYYEEEEAEGTSEDDKEQMRISTISAREALGASGANISDAQIQEALWHYYYDVGKSVSYLKNKFAAAPAPKQEAPSKKEKATSRFDQAASAAVEKAPVPVGKQSHAQYIHAESTYPVASSLPLPPTTMPSNAQDFFWDTPWGNIPTHRQGVITVDEPHFRGGLLGGSSKLAALAAKRRKEREEAQAATNANNEADAAVAMLDKLTVKSKDGSTPTEDAQRPSRISKYTARKRSPSPKPATPVEETIPEPEAPKPAIEVEFPAQRANASMFASTLCGVSHNSESPQTILQEFPAPYSQYKDYQNARPFEGPSPDDIVRAAQANKGAGTGRR